MLVTCDQSSPVTCDQSPLFSRHAVYSTAGLRLVQGRDKAGAQYRLYSGPTQGLWQLPGIWGGSNPDYARDRPNFACRAWARMVKNGQKCFFPERSFLNSLKCVWLPFNYITSYLGCSFMS